MRKHLLLVFALLFFAGCSSSRSGSARSVLGPTEPLTPSEQRELFSGVETASEPTYGYSPENPIRIGHYGAYKGMNAAKTMLNYLDKNGQSLQVVGRSPLRRETGRPDSSEAVPGPYGAPPYGTILDVYSVVPTGTADTLQLYFDSYHVAPLRTPQGLEFTSYPAQ